jgi:hypothetical protein
MARRVTTAFDDLRGGIARGRSAFDQIFTSGAEIDKNTGKGPYLKGLAAMRSVEWGKSWNWDVRFTGPGAPPAPFDKWFPATDYDRTVASLQTMAIPVGPASFEIPKGTSQRTLRLTFMDDDKGTLEDWLTDWFNETMVDPDFGWVATLGEATRRLEIAHLDNQRGNSTLHTLYVYPSDSLQSLRDSASNLVTHVCSFNVVASSRGPMA